MRLFPNEKTGKAWDQSVSPRAIHESIFSPLNWIIDVIRADLSYR